ncbi:glycosyltransferase [Azospirillum sp. INR13]|uniref:glycosyltransferase n=1 Tax=Azospirillum sp. INR13 TaxID=2596919 RepID=UPI0021078ACF|nr:hypothetical protein [Azospirillum sp. INR13]
MQRNDAEHLFVTGNYTGLIALGRDDLWQHHAALGLIGRTDEAIDGLGRFDGTAPRFHEAATLWIAGDETGAIALLARLAASTSHASSPSPRQAPWQAHARSLLALLRKPQIKVLSLLPSPSAGPHVLLAGGGLDPKFALTNIGHATGDRPNSPYASVHRLWRGEAPPDFVLCEMVEWHQIPPDLDSLPCPLLGQTADYDMHIQAMLPWLRLFDEVLVTDHTEHAGVRPLVDAPVTTVPKSFGHPAGLPRLRRRDRDVDLFLSGTLFAAWHPDKAALIHQILGIEGLRLAGFNGFLDNATYYDLLSRSRLAVAYYRRPGGMVTRGIEAACMGCVTLVQEGSVLPLYAGSDHGLVSYPATPDGLARTIRQVLDRYDEHEARAWRAAPRLRQALAPDVVASHYLRLCTVLAARPRPLRRPGSGVGLQERVQKRVVFWKGWQPGGGRTEAVEALEAANIAHWEAVLGEAVPGEAVPGEAVPGEAVPGEAVLDQHDPRHVPRHGPWNDPAVGRAANDMAREMLIGLGCRLMASSEESGRAGDPVPAGSAAAALRTRLFAFQELWIERRPRDLVPRFNALRARLHFGTAQDIADALRAMKITLAAKPDGWALAPEDDVLPYDLFERFFNYRTYLDRVVEGLSEKAHRKQHGEPQSSERLRGDLIRLIRASLHHYLARAAGGGVPGLAHAREAVRLDPDFPFFQLDLAKKLTALTGKAERKEAVELLTRLAGSSMVAVEARDILLRLQAEGGSPATEDPAVNAAQIERTLVDTENYRARLISPYFRTQQIARNGWRGPWSQRMTTAGTPALSVVLVDRAQRNHRILFGELERQTVDRERCERILVELYDDVPEGAARKADLVIACCQTDSVPHPNRGLNAGLLAAAADVTALISGVPAGGAPLGGDRVPPDFLAHALDRLSRSDGPAEVLLHRFSGTGGILVGRTPDLLTWGGLDEHEAFQGNADGIADFAARLRRNGVAVRESTTADLATADLPETGPDPLRLRLWPALAGPDRRQPLLGNPLVVRRADSLRMDNGGLELLERMERSMVVDGHGNAGPVRVPVDAVPSYMLYGPHIRLPAGDYRLVVTGKAEGVRAADQPVLGMEIIQNGDTKLLSGGLAAASLPEGATVAFRIPTLSYRPDGGLEFRIVHLGNATVTVDSLCLHRLNGGER